MLHSMTGYGKAINEINNKRITVEVKSLNSKQTDINARIPGYYREKEVQMRTTISKRLVRGKVDLAVFTENLGGDTSTVINAPVVANYYKQVQAISDNENIHLPEDVLSSLLRLPDSLKTSIEEIKKEEWDTLINTLNEAINQLIEFRKQEGKALLKDIVERVHKIEELHGEILQYEPERIEVIKKRISDSLEEVDAKVEYDKNRFEQEMIYYLEKLDITEEKVRLKNHCKYFLETVEAGDAIGKKLGFISQEIGREINTLGSKANHTKMQQIVVLMKDELEKIKEQILNVL